MKRIILLVTVAVLFTPYLVTARGGNGSDKPHHHQKISADEITVAGLGLAAVLGAAGFLVLRRRRTA